MISKVLKKTKTSVHCLANQIFKASKINYRNHCGDNDICRFVRVLWNYMKDIISHCITKSEVLEKKLLSLRFLMFIGYRCIDEHEHEITSDLLIHDEDVTYTAAHLSFLSLDPAFVVHSEFSKLLETINPVRPELTQIYMSVLKGHSKSSGSKIPIIAHEVVEGFLYALQEDLEELLRRDASLKVAFYDHMPWLQQGLLYLSTFLLNLPTPCSKDQKRYSLLSYIEALASEAGLLVYSFYDEDVDKATLFPLQVKYNHVKIEGDLIKLHEATTMASLKDLIDKVQQDLMLLRTLCSQQIFEL
ncbi:hypothetical protein K7X08_006494 [Anisodus acutangulus]|uniref:Late blight resistance protein R1A-like N-terminal domain-containing protein n=1 Tax=Anisodus acutangulus TaxID=402998 RepID=A0A9Q1MVW6_9SOLA|nr:hypothetical protein K7X08_006494 [Anisodus acutangulus]